MGKRLTLLFSVMVLTACGGAKSEGPALRVRADSLMTAGKGQVQVYARLQDGTVVPVSQNDAAPEGTQTSYAVFRDTAGTVLLLIETPTSTRDWNNEYRHYFDAQGRTVFFRRYSGFFDGCKWGLAKEVLERSYTAEFKPARELYKLTSDEGSPHDSTECEFRYHFPYEVYPTWAAAAQALQLPATVGQ
ncbi:MAG: hypothetical protein FIB01_14045 [Gemmatimonadetes bacterium]|nr:hypothetical protein [Gemmatimonadota bacterium]